MPTKQGRSAVSNSGYLSAALCTAALPNRSFNCARYRLCGPTATPCDSIVPSGIFGSFANGIASSFVSPEHPIAQFIAPEKFAEYGERARAMGFVHVASGPMVRSSYHADDFSAARRD